MGAPLYSDDDFLASFQAKLPTGPAWPRDPDAVQTQALRSLMPAYTRQTARSVNLLTDAFPAAPVELLPEWEATLGLPDPCAGVSPTLQARQAQVKARFIASGGQSIPYFIQFAADLGYTISITQFAPARFGKSFGQPMNGAPWAFAWQVAAPSLTVRPFRFGQDAFGEPFASWDNAVLECEIARLAPAHTIVLFQYGTAAPTSLNATSFIANATAFVQPAASGIATSPVPPPQPPPPNVANAAAVVQPVMLAFAIIGSGHVSSGRYPALF